MKAALWFTGTALLTLAGCDLVLDVGPPTVRLEPPPGTYGERIRVRAESDGAFTTHYWSTDPDAPVAEFERFGTVEIAYDTSFRVYAVDLEGRRSPILEAEYTITDPAPRVVERPVIWSWQHGWTSFIVGREVTYESERLSTVRAPSIYVGDPGSGDFAAVGFLNTRAVAIGSLDGDRYDDLVTAVVATGLMR